MDHLPLMARFNGWVNRRLYAAVASLPEAAYRADLGLFFGSVHATLNHLLVVDRLWAGRIEGSAHGIRSLDQILYDDLPDLSRAREAEDGRLIRLVDGLTPARLAATVVYTRMVGSGEGRARCDHVLITLFNHQTHHRGQVSAALTGEGLAYPALDVMDFLDELAGAGPTGAPAPGSPS